MKPFVNFSDRDSLHDSLVEVESRPEVFMSLEVGSPVVRTVVR